MKFDEIGDQIIDSDLTEALHAFTFQVIRRWQILDRQKNLNTQTLPLVGTKNEYVTVQEAQLTLKTKANLSLEGALTDMELQGQALRKRLGSQVVLWPFSEKLHASLAKGVGSKIRLALPEQLFTELYAAKFSKSKISYVTFRNQVYHKLLEEFSLKKAFLIYLFGATPYAWGTKASESQVSPKRSVAAQAKLADAGIKLSGTYQEPSEMQTKGVHYMEFDLLDFDPFHENGVTAHQLRLLEVMAGYFLLNESTTTPSDLQAAETLAKEVASENPFAKSQIFVQANTFLKQLDRFAQKFGYAKWQGTFDVLKKRLETPAETPSTRLLRTQGKHETLADYGAFLAQNYQEAALLKEPSRDKNTQTILDEAIISGLSYQEVMPSQGIIELNGKLLKRGIQTTRESAIMTELWQQKQLAKQYLSGQAVNTSQAWIVNNRQELKQLYPTLKGKAVIVKNAVGDSKAQTQLFRLPPTQAELTRAFEEQAKETTQVMIEQVVQGSVYRALVVNDEIVSLVERIPANVVGDGRSTLKELINRKNARARAEFETITLGEVERETLKAQGLKLESVIPRGIQVLLRYDATFNTGSQAYEVLDEVDSSYLTEIKRLAEALQLHDGALDIIIPNIYQPYTEQAQMTFLNAHAYPVLALNEYVLLQTEKQPIAHKVIAQFK
ncbi:MAG: bifunctional glutamate--cysteine ligase/glutathione synthetase [Ligilactobacillus animalis]|uniref:bifunctional glutamate--cysteine ligase/glutathione synthetase n=1 Tax=Ligilactobacillus animalis TaxID=1605 RepID=UPI00242B1335|nr:bifunctional glutamate--cysteine ligase/glutathione synthetase [Ligilactobacillus animalis]MCI5941418.1 bifunctional glutamate--cysteine ligase/glutathione synthetase [Ligilactobacillus animalis]MDY2993989.1 bifunctional glutamate--cysteine ligase/glutathione synthetase [Ligilactobacillus animalis]